MLPSINRRRPFRQSVHTMTRAIRTTIAALAVAITVGTLACYDKHPAAPDDAIPDLPTGVFVSNASALAYVAAVPGTFPGAASAAIRNQTRQGATKSVQLADGGFDPVGIEAATGDELSLTVLTASGGSTPLALMVPARRLLGVVRTDPARGRTGVALNVQVTAVFTEPIDRFTVTSSSVRLRVEEGNEVIGNVHVSADGLTVRFIPDNPLQPETPYEFLLNSGIHDLDGDVLTGSGASFTTVAVGTIVVTSATTAKTSSDLDPDGYGVIIAGLPAQEPISVNGVLTFGNLAARVHVVTLSGVSENCTVAATATREVLVAAGATTTVAFDVACESTRIIPLGGQLAFVSERDGNSEIYSIDPDGTGLLRLTNNDAHDRDPAWSPDGKRIAFVSNRNVGLNIYVSDVYVMDADGLNVVRLTVGGMNSAPAWSPDGTRIAFAGVKDGQGGIFVMSLGDLANVRNVGHPRGYHADPAWSPDGTKIAFTSDWLAYDFVYDLYVAKADGSGITTLLQGPFLDGPLTYYFQAAWSPDGRQIAVVVCAYAWANCYPSSSIAVGNADGSGLKTLVGTSGLARPAWSPDGSSIAYSSQDCPGCVASLRYVGVGGGASGLIFPNGHSPSWRR